MDETKKEPTTAELFARARADINAHDPSHRGRCALSALSELERRMGAMARALRELTVGHNDDQRCICSGCASITDAPAVFTLEEVERESKAMGQDWVRITDLLERLAALRRGT